MKKIEWITENKEIKKYLKTRKEALDNAMNVIDAWCKENGWEYRVSHNTNVDLYYHKLKNANRCVIIYRDSDSNNYRAYAYKLTIKSWTEFEEKVIGQEVIDADIFGEEMIFDIIERIQKPTLYYADLKRL